MVALGLRVLLLDAHSVDLVASFSHVGLQVGGMAWLAMVLRLLAVLEA